MTITFRPSPTAVLLSNAWLWCSLLLTMAYQSNLRAFLVAVDYERAIDSSRDIIELDAKLYLPKGRYILYSIISVVKGPFALLIIIVGTSVVSSMRDSPTPDHKTLFKSVEEKDGFFYLEVRVKIRPHYTNQFKFIYIH